MIANHLDFVLTCATVRNESIEYGDRVMLECTQRLVQNYTEPLK